MDLLCIHVHGCSGSVVMFPRQALLLDLTWLGHKTP